MGDKLMRFLVAVFKAVHEAIGISTPPPDQERRFVYMWLGILAVMGLWVIGVIVASVMLLNR